MKIYIETMGCPKNTNDSQVAAGILEEAGDRVVLDPTEADAIMVNTCGFIEDAKTESIQAILSMADLARQVEESGKTRPLLLVTGCLSQRYGEELFEELPEVDLFLGVNDYDRLPRILEEHRRGSREKYIRPYTEELETPLRRRTGPLHTATLKIAEGCNNRCTYCAIPDIRGPYRSRRQEDVLAEAKRLAGEGVRELILIAQDTTAYGMEEGEYRLAGLLRELCRIDGVDWIRLMFCYEDRITDELIRVMAAEPKICHYVDLPLQHASDRILTAMKRRSTASSIKDTILRLRKAIPDIHIRTTLITGFPGETEEDFAALLSLVEETGFQRLGVFAYSREEGTPAATMKDQVPRELAEERRDAILRRQIEISRRSNEEKIGRTLTVLLEEREDEKGQPDLWLGRTEYDAPEIDCQVLVHARKAHAPGDMIPVKIEDAFDYDLVGREVAAPGKTFAEGRNR